MVGQAQTGCGSKRSHCKLNDTARSLSPPSYPTHDLCLANDAAHIQGGSSFLGRSSLEKPPQCHSELCLLGGSKSRQAGN